MARTLRSESAANDALSDSTATRAEWRKVLDRRDARRSAVRNLDAVMRRRNKQAGFSSIALLQGLAALAAGVISAFGG